MQTFLPFSCFKESAKVLDTKRLGKQRLEGLQILNVLLGYSNIWKNHPAVKMWTGYEIFLARYIRIIIQEWINRGYKDTRMQILENIWNDNLVNHKWSRYYIKPNWLGDEKFHSSHRAALLAKKPEWYSQFGWREEAKIDYYWPV